MSLLIKPCASYFLSYATTRIATQGFSDLFGLVTLRHGTNPIYWLGIHVLGAQPIMGGSKIGGDAYFKSYHSQNINNFYVTTDRFYYSKYINSYDITSTKVERSFKNKIIPKVYTLTSTENLLNNFFIPKRLNAILSISLMALLPTIKFHLQEGYVKKEFSNDATMPGTCAVYTGRPIGPWNLGLIGILWNSLSTATLHNMLHNLDKVCWGIGELAFSMALGLAVAKAFPALFIANKTAMIAGAILAAI